MKLIIEIPDYIVESVKNSNICNYEKFKIFEAIKNGTPLPKGHGRLIDANELLKHTHTIGTSNYCEYNVAYVETVKEVPTIIEADKAESEDKE